MSDYPPIVFGEELLWLIEYGAIVSFAILGISAFIAAYNIWSRKAGSWSRILRIRLQWMIIVSVPTLVFHWALFETLHLYYALIYGIVALVIVAVATLKSQKKLDSLLKAKQNIS